ncbi:hypothetical protein ACR79K_25380 [Sphingobacterium siyangense]|uniref:hypothetical protein n=1 Tax=Sphingobacterium siyangense TaxID=459529 RepID=UPI003DA37C73
MAKYFYVSTEEKIELEKVFPVTSIVSITHINGDNGEHFTRIETVNNSMTVLGSIEGTINALDGKENVVWFEPRNVQDDFDFTIS